MSPGPPETGQPGQRDRVRLDPNLIASEVDGGRIAENILYFGRLLRASGLRVGPEKIVLATRAVLATGIDNPRTLYWTLHAVLVNRRSDHDLFTQAFWMFWKDPAFLDQMMAMMLPTRPADATPDGKEMSRRLAETLLKGAQETAPHKEEELEIDASGTTSDIDVVREKDFEQMSAAELSAARRAISELQLGAEPIRTRRYEWAAKGERIDLRRMLRETAAKGGDSLMPAFKRRRMRRPPLVVLCDISGSMDTYARVFLHFLYALANDRDRVSAFLFGTHLSHVTRELKNRDPDAAIAKVSRGVTDWSGGTRIGGSLEEFNRHWARRVLGQNATVLLFTDGLDREGGAGIERAARRLGASARRLIWLNPLLRWDGYEPIAAGARALSRHVTEVRPCHNVRSLAELAKALDQR